MGDYFGEEAPDSIPQLFAAGIISPPDYEHRSPAFAPDGNYFFLGSNRNGNFDIYWIKARFVLGLLRSTP